jgi:hypothetical protein
MYVCVCVCVLFMGVYVTGADTSKSSKGAGGTGGLPTSSGEANSALTTSLAADAKSSVNTIASASLAQDGQHANMDGQISGLLERRVDMQARAHVRNVAKDGDLALFEARRAGDAPNQFYQHFANSCQTESPAYTWEVDVEQIDDESESLSSPYKKLRLDL